jgi:nucleoside phosphorylase
MALEDYLESEVAIAVAATAAVLSPRVRRVLRRGAVYGVVGALKATDVVTAAARGVASGVSSEREPASTGGGRGEASEQAARPTTG